MCRGLIIDKRRGNMLKADRHKYVKLAFHGFAPLSREARMAQYNNAGGMGWGGVGWGWAQQCPFAPALHGMPVNTLVSTLLPVVF